ncbi:uncharacterized protein THITE_2128271 [Thermothielavioides terrestris NRRL 8126]|uniref:Uncharacterized protein n=1 Tax=Thermothielavioides terrestris (strain ATCC 38088 / NRRL 8126) TaxID=578455 RepID=G2R586_THETT|nr:uncharacterized protein THITE_2128271 [Thermothielavioides terrestris NRRL 8126]AEO66169.1 hypothetical protein THITE_2128271 [Thermothielavioides terrestris NRRL 8126]
MSQMTAPEIPLACPDRDSAGCLVAGVLILGYRRLNSETVPGPGRRTAEKTRGHSVIFRVDGVTVSDRYPWGLWVRGTQQQQQQTVVYRGTLLSCRSGVLEGRHDRASRDCIGTLCRPNPGLSEDRVRDGEARGTGRSAHLGYTATTRHNKCRNESRAPLVLRKLSVASSRPGSVWRQVQTGNGSFVQDPVGVGAVLTACAVRICYTRYARPRGHSSAVWLHNLNPPKYQMPPSPKQAIQGTSPHYAELGHNYQMQIVAS